MVDGTGDGKTIAAWAARFNICARRTHSQGRGFSNRQTGDLHTILVPFCRLRISSSWTGNKARFAMSSQTSSVSGQLPCSYSTRK